MLQINVPFVTNRPVTGLDFGPPPEPSSFAALTYGSGVVSASADPFYEGALLPGQIAIGGTDAGVAAEPDPRLIGFLRAWLRSAAAGDQMPLVYVHGFEFSFEQALELTADLAACFAADPARTRVAPLVFSFPTHDSAWAYRQDRGYAQLSGVALARFLTALNKAWLATQSEAMMLLAHSMGCFVLDNGCGALVGQPPLEGPMFAQALVMAGDVVRGALDPGHGLYNVSDLATWVTVGVNAADTITAFVAQYGGVPFPRLAAMGPDDVSVLQHNVRVVDYSYVVPGQGTVLVPTRTAEWNYVGHGYYHTIPRVRVDLEYVLANRDPNSIPGRQKGPGPGGSPEQYARLYVMPSLSPATILEAQVTTTPPVGTG